MYTVYLYIYIFKLQVSSLGVVDVWMLHWEDHDAHSWKLAAVVTCSHSFHMNWICSDGHRYTFTRIPYSLSVQLRDVDICRQNQIEIDV